MARVSRVGKALKVLRAIGPPSSLAQELRDLVPGALRPHLAVGALTLLERFHLLA
jgi:hypothetical protein